MRQDLLDLFNEIVADGTIDTEECTKIEAKIFEDGKVDEEEIKFMMQLNNAASEKCPEWTELYVKAVDSYALQDEETPGVVSEEEGQVLLEGMKGEDGTIDAVEVEALFHLRDMADEIECEELSDFIDDLEELDDDDFLDDEED